MSEPLYEIGQKVAVCTSSLAVVIPSTTVISIVWRNPGQWLVNPEGSWVSKGHYAYKVEGHEINPLTGREVRFAEWCLRPLKDDEYKDTLQDEQPINQWKGKQHKSPEEIQRMMDNAG